MSKLYRRGLGLRAQEILRATLSLYVLASLASKSVMADEAVIREIIEIVRSQSLTTVPSEADSAVTVDGLISILKGVDPYVSYEPPSGGEHDPHRLTLGLGVDISTLGPRTLLMPRRNGPAFAAGLEDAAYLDAIDGKLVAGLNLAEIEALVGNARGGRARLTVTTATGVRNLVVPLVELSDQQASVEAFRNGPTLVVRIHDFVKDETAQSIRNAMVRYQHVIDLTVIDLRLNPGGNFYEALDAASLFLPLGAPLAATLDRHNNVQRFVALPQTLKILKIPIVAVISEHTASAAEAFARALQFNARAIVLGRRSFGKCLSQKRVRLINNGELFFTNLTISFADNMVHSECSLTPDQNINGQNILSIDMIIEYIRNTI